MSAFEETEETKINLKYRHAFSTDELQQTKSTCHGGFSRKHNEDVLTEITASTIHRDSSLTVIGLLQFRGLFQLQYHDPLTVLWNA